MGPQRYWGGAGGPTGAPAGVGRLGSAGPTLRASRTPSFDAPVQYRGFTGAPLTRGARHGRSRWRRSPSCVPRLLLPPHLPWRVLVTFVLGVLATPGATAPLRSAHPVGEPRSGSRSCSNKVWLRFRYAPTWWPYRPYRWDMAVRTDTFQVTNWIWGSRAVPQHVLPRSEAVMWREIVRVATHRGVGSDLQPQQGRVPFSADGGNPPLGRAARAVCRRVGPRSRGAREHRAPRRRTPRPRSAARGAPTRVRARGSDLGSARATTPRLRVGARRPVPPAPTPRQPGRRLRRETQAAHPRPRRRRLHRCGGARRSGPVLLATLVRVTDGQTDAQPRATTGCCTAQLHHGDLERQRAENQPLVARKCHVRWRRCHRIERSDSTRTCPYPATHARRALGPVTITLPAVAATDEVSCQAFSHWREIRHRNRLRRG